MEGPGRLQTDEILDLVERHNDRETRFRRGYYAYLQTQGPQSESFEEHLEEHAFLARFSGPATAEAIRELEALAGVAFPAELWELYGSLGGLRVHNRVAFGIELLSVPQLLHGLRSQVRWEHYRSLGLVDMMSASWCNDRPELEPEAGFLDAEEIAGLNDAYTCIGWIPDGYCEGYRYIYFDRAGAFATLDSHQDTLATLCSEHLRPMLGRSPAAESLSSILVAGLHDAFRILDELEREDGG
jgi:hypothetical protein